MDRREVLEKVLIVMLGAQKKCHTVTCVCVNAISKKTCFSNALVYTLVVLEVL